MLQQLKRSATSGYTDGSNGPFTVGQYQFYESSDSDSSSSDDERRHRRLRKKRKSKEEKTVGDGTRGDKARKKDAEKGRSFSRFAIKNDQFKTKGRVSKRDGRLNISVNETANSGYIAKALGQSIKHHLDLPSRYKSRKKHEFEDAPESDADAESLAESMHVSVKRPRMNIVIMVIGSRGDIQPFLKIGRLLQHTYGHRVRIATHPAFREFVTKDSGLDFFSVGGNPSELMAFMVKNPGLIPNMQTVREGEIQRRRAQMAEMFDGFWRACVNATDDEGDKTNMKMMGDRFPFIADAIIANPPSFAHVHIAERLGIPLHMMFTFPYSPTQQFPHPLANIKPQKSNVDANYVNFMSYPLVEMMTWQGLGDLVNKFRVRTLGLEPVSSLWAPGALYRMKVPYSYCFSPGLVPKPKDWGPEIDICGFTFLELGHNFKPPKELQDFLDNGDTPIYIGFGSIVVDDPKEFTKMIFKAIKLAGVRALVNEGWGGLGGGETPDNVYMLGNTPHDWLFPRVKAVVHHGGAGTTAIGLKCAKPTMIVPFFGDQPFWGAMVADAKAGAHECIPYKRLTAERMAEGIKQCLTEEAQQNVQKIADSIAKEGDGAENAVKSFHRSLPLTGRHSMRCSILEDRVSVWKLHNSSLRLSSLAAELLVEKGKVRWSDLQLMRHYEWNDFDGPGEPITGGAGAIAKSFYGMGEGVGMVPVRIAKHIQRREEAERKQQESRQRREARKEKKAEQAADRAAIDARIAERSGDTDVAQRQLANQAEAIQRPHLLRDDTVSSAASHLSHTKTREMRRETARDIGRGLKESGKAFLTMPNDLHVAIAQGFHNAPRLWGDATVRKPVKITGFRTGWKAARREFGYGIYDGVTGLVTQPVGGWKDGETVPAKFLGVGAGIGKGIGGFVLKDISAIIAPPAFFGKGLIKHIEHRLGGETLNSFVRRAHIIQGQKDLRALKIDPNKIDEFKKVQRLVNDGWRVYQEIWETQHRYRDAAGHGLFKQRHIEKEKQKWARNGALENVDTANRALDAYKQGEDVERVFTRRRQEVKLAEQPRASAMTQPKDYEDAKDILPNGHTVQSAKGAACQGSQQDGDTRSSSAPAQQHDDTSETAVESDVEEDVDANETNFARAAMKFAHPGTGAVSVLGDIDMGSRTVASAH
ncbi:glycosyltransferase family 1 protein [Polychaeton citri CBS 116435]|uniref:Glycosyltransferase family 1 protein n=1 Tax=Polychaeton citri CBS 116435 TaxID=1314669 RepID=A0A9P4QI64_9PEZI|nr:glycosyltransferase family 1 protein [Polychaeton citri CBS 116435]